MPVDKFGRDNSIQNNISSGVSVRYVKIIISLEEMEQTMQWDL